MNKFDDSDFPSRVPGSPKYTNGDRREFERLADFPVSAGDHGSGSLGGLGPRLGSASQQEATSQTSIRYSSADERAFEKLSIPSGTRASGQPRAPGWSTDSAKATGYTAADARLFEQLGSFDRPQSLGLETMARGAVTPSLPAAASGYSQQDLEAFAVLAPNERTVEQQAALGDDARSADKRSDVGYIKIVDFDREHVRGRNSRDATSTTMKIRFFD